MADELDPVEGVPEPVVVAPEDESVEIASPRTIEDYARERGWKTREEHTGEGEWRDAETFISFGLDRGRDLSRDVKDLRSTMERMARTQADITQRAVDQARQVERAKWENQLTDAVETGDHARATEATQKIAELAVAPVTQGNEPLVQNFVRENAWFNTDPAANAVAIATAETIARTGGSIEEQLKAAKEAVLKRFPEYGPTPAPAPAKVIDVSAPTARLPARQKGAKGFAEMPAEAQAVAKQLVQRGLIKSVDGYAQQYWNPEGAIE